MPFVRCTKTTCPNHAVNHFKYPKGNDRVRCHAPYVVLRRRDKQHLVFDCLENTALMTLERLIERR